MSEPEFLELVGTDIGKLRRKQNSSLLAQNDAPEPTLNGGHGNAIVNPRWAYAGDTYWTAAETCDRLPAGFYRCDNRPVGPCLQRITIKTDNLLRLPDTASETVLQEFQTFWRLKHRFKQRGFLHKRGILLWGPPGSGKTASLMLMAEDVIEHLDGIVVEIDHPDLAGMCLGAVRRIEPERRIVALLEDIDALVDRHGENRFLALLDGETQIDNILYVATTNYPERLDRRFVDRPSRFDTIRWIGMPNAKARRMYLHSREPDLHEDELSDWVSKTQGFSVAHLRELVILVRCFEYPLTEAIKRLESMRMRLPNSGDAPDKPLFGIGGHRDVQTGGV